MLCVYGLVTKYSRYGMPHASTIPCMNNSRDIVLKFTITRKNFLWSRLYSGAQPVAQISCSPATNIQVAHKLPYHNILHFYA